jgi:hypothetical protein
MPFLQLILISMTLLPVTAGADNGVATVLSFSERDPLVENPYQTRMLVTTDYLRMDDGGADDDFVLLDRRSRTIYSVSHEDQRVVVVKSREVKSKAPETFVHRTEEGDAGRVPDIDGKRVHLYRFYTNDTMCFEVYAVPGFLDDAVAALKQFAEVLAGQHALTRESMPAELQTACDLANTIYKPTRYLSRGFPIRQRDDIGRVRTLLDVKKNIKIQPQLFEIPVKYEKFYPGESRI